MTTHTSPAPTWTVLNPLRPRPLTARLLVLAVRVVIVFLVVLSAVLAARSLAVSGGGSGVSPTPGRVTTPHPVPAGF